MFFDIDSCKSCFVDPDGSIKDAIKSIDSGGFKIALVTQNLNLYGTVCDGDIRRGILKGIELTASVKEVMQTKFIKYYENKIKGDLDKECKENNISQIPILSENGFLKGLFVQDQILPIYSKKLLPNCALIMAGGKGLRLRPLTENCPKPLLPINGKPILEIIIQQCINAGINKFFISVHYLSEQIVNYFGDGSNFGIEINYIYEDAPLGTAGSMQFLKGKVKESILVINGDLLTKANINDIFSYHQLNDAEITICVRENNITSPYGVIEVDGIKYKKMTEKPTFKYLVNAGIYVFQDKVIDLIKEKENIDMPELIERSKSLNKNIIVYPIHEYWLDIGRHESLSKAHTDWVI